ncbi:MAG: GH3 auxin-responsive promoter family protein [Bacteroidales bacterium]|nr:GH3 auxin-responsive promoter family protein [Bacteroidales bacterium]MCM1414294.1 GH3 auxin-responsive promoter family protein [bacterium]MCM1422175.1 GH3 auxin-responsive promoter family protein [bacterium]
MGAAKTETSATKSFLALCKDAVAVQEKFLLDRLAENKDTEYGKLFGFEDIHSVEEYQKELPITFHYDYEAAIDRQLGGEAGTLTADKPVFYCISSGSTDSPKYVPIVEQDIKRQYFYWHDLIRETIRRHIPDASDEELFGKIFETGEFRRNFMEDGTMSGVRASALNRYLEAKGEFDIDCYTAPLEVVFPEQMEDMLYVKLRFALACREVTAIHGVFVNRVVGMFRYLVDNWEDFLSDIETGKVSDCFPVSHEWQRYLEEKLPADPERAAELRQIPTENLQKGLVRKIWPKIRYGQLIGGSMFAAYMDKLWMYVEDLPIHFFTYAASEGCFGIVRDMGEEDAFYVLLPDTCFYEFMPETGDGERIYTIRDVEVGSKYEILITTLSGMYRYAIGDVVEVVGFEGQAPVVRVCYRKSQVINIADEKMNVRQLENAMRKFQRRAECSAEGYCVDGDYTQKLPRYLLYLELSGGKMPEDAAEILDECLMESCSGYKRDRELAELEKVFIQPVPKGAFKAYGRFMAKLGRRKEQDKPLRILITEEQKAFFGGALLS